MLKKNSRCGKREKFRNSGFYLSKIIENDIKRRLNTESLTCVSHFVHLSLFLCKKYNGFKSFDYRDLRKLLVMNPYEREKQVLYCIKLASAPNKNEPSETEVKRFFFHNCNSSSLIKPKLKNVESKSVSSKVTLIVKIAKNRKLSLLFKKVPDNETILPYLSPVDQMLIAILTSNSPHINNCATFKDPTIPIITLICFILRTETLWSSDQRPPDQLLHLRRHFDRHLYLLRDTIDKLRDTIDKLRATDGMINGPDGIPQHRVEKGEYKEDNETKEENNNDAPHINYLTLIYNILSMNLSVVSIAKANAQSRSVNKYLLLSIYPPPLSCVVSMSILQNLRAEVVVHNGLPRHSIIALRGIKTNVLNVKTLLNLNLNLLSKKIKRYSIFKKKTYKNPLEIKIYLSE